MSDPSDQTMPPDARVSLWVRDRWGSLSAEQQLFYVIVLTAWIDQTRVDARKFFDLMGVAVDAAQAAAALNAYHKDASETADSAQLDLLTISGEHVPAADDQRRRAMYGIGVLSTVSHLTKQ